MRVVVMYRTRDRVAGRRLHDDLAARLGSVHVSRNVAVADPDAVIVVIGPDWARAPDERAAEALERALVSGAPIVPVVLEGAEMPDADDLPASLADLAAIEPVAASYEYWSETVDRVHQALRPPRRRGIARVVALARRRPRLSIVTGVVGLAASTVGILAASGVINPPPELPDPPEKQTLRVAGRVGSGVTFAQYLGDHRDEHVTRRDYPLSEDLEGFVYGVEVGLENAKGVGYSLRATLRDAVTDNQPEGFRSEFVGARFSPADAGRLHYVWIPCARDDLRFYVQFDLVNDAEAAPLQSKRSAKPQECREVGP
jgi:hypothetical protein